MPCSQDLRPTNRPERSQEAEAAVVVAVQEEAEDLAADLAVVVAVQEEAEDLATDLAVGVTMTRKALAWCQEATDQAWRNCRPPSDSREQLCLTS